MTFDMPFGDLFSLILLVILAGFGAAYILRRR